MQHHQILWDQQHTLYVKELSHILVAASKSSGVQMLGLAAHDVR